MSATANESLGPRLAATTSSGWGAQLGANFGKLIPLGAAIGALAVQLIRPTNLDVSWLLTVNDRILAGVSAYQGVIELNPPASILLYRIPALIAKLLSIRAELVVAGRLEQRSWESQDGDRRSKVEVVADEVGPSLRWATAQITKNDRRGPSDGGRGGRPPTARDEPPAGGGGYSQDEEPF